MSNQLSEAYTVALSKLDDERVTMVVKAVIESKNNLAEFEGLVETLHIDGSLKRMLIASMVEQVSDSVATMCNLIGKGFRAEVLPLVEKVTNEAKKSKKLQ